MAFCRHITMLNFIARFYCCNFVKSSPVLSFFRCCCFLMLKNFCNCVRLAICVAIVVSVCAVIKISLILFGFCALLTISRNAGGGPAVNQKLKIIIKSLLLLLYHVPPPENHSYPRPFYLHLSLLKFYQVQLQQKPQKTYFLVLVWLIKSQNNLD